VIPVWPDEYEALRAQARQLAESIVQSYHGGQAVVPTEQSARVEVLRAFMAANEVEAPEGADETIAGVPCRVFGTASARGTYLHFHGGAMIVGSPRMDDIANAKLPQRFGARVVSVDYRLAPEHPFPQGSDDCLAVTCEVLERSEGPVVMGGESAGAYYTVLTLLRLRDEMGVSGRVAGANLVFGVYDLSGTPSSLGTRPSTVPDSLDDAHTDLVLECYLPGRSRLDARAARYSPLYADLSALPGALFTVGSADHLLDDSLFMAARWQAWGNPAELAVYPDCVHGFTGFPIELSKRAHARIDAFLDRCFT
jgi:acetyl esterase/lipase